MSACASVHSSGVLGTSRFGRFSTVAAHAQRLQIREEVVRTSLSTRDDVVDLGADVDPHWTHAPSRSITATESCRHVGVV
jgi:hypothetical protein